MSESLLKVILQSEQTVFSIKELSLLWGKSGQARLRSQISYYLEQGYLYHLRRGLYAKSKEYNRFEVATKIMSPSYISFETVLLRAGIIFQYYERVFAASYRTRIIECDKKIYEYRTLKSTLLTDPAGIELKPYYSIASPERAFLDMIYLHKSYYFDNLSPLDWNRVYEILKIYKNKRMETQVDNYYREYKEKNGV